MLPHKLWAVLWRQLRHLCQTSLILWTANLRRSHLENSFTRWVIGSHAVWAVCVLISPIFFFFCSRTLSSKVRATALTSSCLSKWIMLHNLWKQCLTLTKTLPGDPQLRHYRNVSWNIDRGILCFHCSLRVLASILSNRFLHREIRYKFILIVSFHTIWNI